MVFLKRIFLKIYMTLKDKKKYFFVKKKHLKFDLNFIYRFFFCLVKYSKLKGLRHFIGAKTVLTLFFHMSIPSCSNRKNVSQKVENEERKNLELNFSFFIFHQGVSLTHLKYTEIFTPNKN